MKKTNTFMLKNAIILTILAITGIWYEDPLYRILSILCGIGGVGACISYFVSQYKNKKKQSKDTDNEE